MTDPDENKYLEMAISFIESSVYDEVEQIWKNVVGEEIPEYRILVWGSVYEPRGSKPTDLDIIIEYTGSEIEPDKANSIESWLKSAVNPQNFSYVDPVVVQYHQTPNIISQSRVSGVYSVDERGEIIF